MCIIVKKKCCSSVELQAVSEREKTDIKKRDSLEKSPLVLQKCRRMKRNEEVKTSPVELGNSCQEWAGPPAEMRQHRGHECINTYALCIFNSQMREELIGSAKDLKKSS